MSPFHFGLLMDDWEQVEGMDSLSLPGSSSHLQDEVSAAVWSWFGTKHEATSLGG